MTFTEAMRSKARLSITGPTSENGCVPVAYLHPGLPMSLSMTDPSWPRPDPVPYRQATNSFFSSDPYWRTEMCIIFSINLLLIPVFDSLTLYSFIVTKKSHFPSTNPLFQGLMSSTDLRGLKLMTSFPFLEACVAGCVPRLPTIHI